MSDQRAIAKKTRASKPKVTTGCNTCKERHIKCDEGKPTCLKCSNGRRKCRWKPQLQCFQYFGKSPLLTHPGTLPGGEQEREYFHFFRLKTLPQLSGFSESNFWTYEVLQACITERAVWHAAVALGSLHQQTRLGLQRRSRGGIASRFTIQQYTQAVGILGNSSLTERKILPDSFLICCVLFTCFESLRGHRSTALMHFRKGLNIICSLWASQPISASLAYNIPTTKLTSLQCISLIFTRLEVQTTQFLSYQQVFLRPKTAQKARTASLHIPSKFNNIEVARCASDCLWMFVLYAFEKPTPYSVSDTYGNTDGVKLQQCSQLLQQWSQTFERFLENSGSNLDVTARQVAIAMRINELIASLSLTTEGSQGSQCNTEQQFSEIISIATEIIDTHVEGRLENSEICISMDTSVVGPLYHVALRCKHRILRRKAIALLRLRKRVEGLWDSRFLADVAERFMEVEEGMFGESVKDLKVVFDFEEGKAEVQFVCQDNDIEKKKTEKINWPEW